MFRQKCEGIFSTKCKLYTSSSWSQMIRSIYIEMGNQGNLSKVGNTWLEHGETNMKEFARWRTWGGCFCDVWCIGWMSSCLSGHIFFTSLDPPLLPTPVMISPPRFYGQSSDLCFVPSQWLYSHPRLPWWTSNILLSRDPTLLSISLFTQKVRLSLMTHAANGIHHL